MEYLFKPDLENKTRKKQKERKINSYNVILLNDNYTTMDFVVEILIKIFKKNQQDANDIMLEVHNNGKSIAGNYHYDIAITKIEQVHALAAEKEYPFRCILEGI